MSLILDESLLLGASPENLARLARSMGYRVDASMGRGRLAIMVAGAIEYEQKAKRAATQDQIDTAILAAEQARARGRR